MIRAAACRHFGLIALVSFLCLAGCSTTRGGPISYNVENFGPPDAPSEISLSPDYRIAPLDTVAVSVFQIAELSGNYKVDLTGRIAFPLIGTVKALDLTTVELQDQLKKLLSDKYLNNPDVTVGVIDSSGSKITVDGNVRQPGVFTIAGDLTLIQAIAMAKGVDDLANPKRVAVFRQINGTRIALSHGAAQNILVSQVAGSR